MFKNIYSNKYIESIYRIDIAVGTTGYTSKSDIDKVIEQLVRIIGKYERRGDDHLRYIDGYESSLFKQEKELRSWCGDLALDRTCPLRSRKQFSCLSRRFKI